MKKTYFCPKCEKATEHEEGKGKAIFCRYCGTMINLQELKDWSEEQFKKKGTKKKDA